MTEADDLALGVGLLMIEWSRLEERFPGSEFSVDLTAASETSGISERQLHRVRLTRNRAAHSSPRPSLDEIDEALGVLRLVLDGVGNQDAEDQDAIKIHVPLTAPRTRSGPQPPETYPNPRGDNPWDNDAVHWLLEQPEVIAAGLTRGTLMECLRLQPNRVERQPDRVRLAAQLARKYGVIQRQEWDERLGKRIVRLYRTDPDRPTYPGTPPDPTG